MRNGEVGTVLAFSSPHFDWIEWLREAQSKDPTVVALRDEIIAGLKVAHWSIIDGLAVFDSMLYVAHTPPLLQ